jgi:hypothetical protein
MISMNRRNRRQTARIAAVTLAVSALALSLPGVLSAQTTATAEQIECLAPGENGVVRGTARGGTMGSEPRLYFRWDDHGPFYWVEMQAEGGGNYWAVPPKPEDRNEMVEYYVEVVDAAGERLGRSETLTAPVDEDCELSLTPEQEGVAENMIVGETAPEQEGEEVMGFLCDGIVARVDYRGIRRADEICRACVIAWWKRPAVLVPAAAAVVGVGVVLDDDGGDEASPSRP